MDPRPVHGQCGIVAALLLGSFVEARQFAEDTDSSTTTGEDYACYSVLVQATARGLNRCNRFNKGECGGGYELVDVANAAKRDHGEERSF